MRRSLFKKYLLSSSAVIITTFFLMGALLYVSMSNYWIDEKLDDLTQSAEKLSSLTAEHSFKTPHGKYSIDSDAKILLTVFSASTNSDVFIVGNNGKILLASDSMDSLDKSGVVSASIMEELKHGNYSSLTTLGGLYDENQYAVGVPINYIEENGTATMIGALFMTSTARAFTAFRRDIVQICVITAIFAAAISFMFSGAIVYQMISPLKEMSIAAASFGKGDFSKRVRVRSQDEIGELAIAFNNMAISLSTSENMNRSFVANVSHELKTPMTTISGFIDGILDGTIPADQQKHYLNIVSSEVKRLSRLVRSMLALSRIDSGEMKLRRADFKVKDIVIDTLLTYENLIDNRSISIEGLDLCEDVSVNGDPDLIHQVIYNLVENAVKFVNNNGTITVGIDASDQFVSVRIRNTGTGIAPDELPLIFDRFYKTDKSRNIDKNGMGLGLFIVKTIIQLHDGDITVRSTVNEFCEFEFRLPIFRESDSDSNQLS